MESSSIDCGLPEKNVVLTSVITTSKISILVLIKAYCYKEIPQKCIPPILSMLVEMIENEPSKSPKNHTNNETDLIQSFFPSLSNILNSIDSNVMSFFESAAAISEIEVNEYTKSIKQYFLNEIWTIKSLDDFYTFLKDSSTLLFDPKPKWICLDSHSSQTSKKPLNRLYSSSFLGDFVSIVSSGVSSMNFEDCLHVWKGFQDYREESKSIWQSINGADIISHSYNQSSDFVDFDLNVQGKTDVYSHIDLVNLFKHQVSTLQKRSSPLSDSLVSLLKSLSQSDRALLPSSYQVEYLNSWRQGDYDESFNSLHRYFDYMMSSKRQYFYHYALLALATLHSSFGAHKEALRAIDEAIVVARENKDLDCLNYLLTWLLNFMITKPQLCLNSKSHPSRFEIIDFLRSKTTETKNLSLQAISFQFEVLSSLLEGSNLASVMENTVKTLYLIMNFENTEELKSLFIGACQLADTIWKRVGYPQIGSLYVDVAIDFAKENKNELDLALLYIRRSNELFFNGKVNEAFVLMESVEKMVKDDFAMSKKWSTANNLLKLYFNLNKGQYRDCSILLDKMSALDNENEDQEINNEFLYQKAIYFSKIGNISESFNIVTSQLSIMKENSLMYNNHWFIRFQVLYAKIFIKYTKYPERAMSILLNAINVSQKFSLFFNLSEAIITLGQLLLKVDPRSSLENIKELLTLFLPKLLEMGRCDMISEAYLLLAEAEFLLFKRQSIENVKLLPTTLLKYIDMAVQGYESVFSYENLKTGLILQLEISEFCALPSLEVATRNKLDILAQVMTDETKK